MSCQPEKIMLYVLDELNAQDKQIVKTHLNQCPHCQREYNDIKETHHLLHDRKPPSAPPGLAKSCIQRLRQQIQPKKRTRHFSWLFWESPHPALQLAFVIIIFISGLSIGGLIFSPQNPLTETETSANSSGGDLGISLHNYLLSVETLLLDLSNIDQTLAMSPDQMRIEIDLAREVLNKTQTIKGQVEDNPRLYRLVDDIEWLLDDMMGNRSTNFADMSSELQDFIQENQILNKINQLKLSSDQKAGGNHEL